MAKKPNNKIKYSDITEVHIKPTGFHILVLSDPVEDEVEDDEDVLKHKSGLVMLKGSEYDKERQREQAGQVYGTLVAVGPLAWADFDRFASKESGWHQWAKPGDRISYARYAGKFITDPITNIQYTLMNDRDLTAVIA